MTTQNYKNLFDELDQGAKSSNSNTQEANWMIAITDGANKFLTSSENTQQTKSKLKLNQYSQIYDHQFLLTRGFSAESSSSLMPDGGLTAHELKIVVPMASVKPEIHTTFSQNVLLKSIHLIRLTLLATKYATKTPYEISAEYTFQNAYISGLISKNDLLCIGFRYGAIHYTKTAFSPIKATKEGKAAGAYHNLITGLTNSKNKVTSK